MNKTKIENLENLLNERWQIAVMTDKEKGNEDGEQFLPNNPDYIYYKGLLDAAMALGFDYKRRNGVHTLFK